MGNLLGAVDVRRSPTGLEFSVDKGLTWTAVGSNSDAWFAAETAALQALIPATPMRFEYIKPGQNPVGATQNAVAVVGTLEGGSLGVSNGTTYLPFATNIYQTPRTSPMAMSFRCKFPAIQAATAAIIGVAAGNTIIVGTGFIFAVNATKWITSVSGVGNTATATNADTLVHTVRLVADPVTGLITFQFDGVTIAAPPGQVATLTNSPCTVASFSDLALTPGVQVSRIAYGYADPT